MLASLTVFAQAEVWVWGGVAAGVVLLGVLAYVCRYQILILLPLWILSRFLYRIKVYGRENVPREGPVLLVCNHVSHIDAAGSGRVAARACGF